jgi:hypothetical protein
MNTPIEEDEGAGNCAKHAFTGTNWVRKAWAIAAGTGNFADKCRSSAANWLA